MRYWATGDFHGDAMDFKWRVAKIPEGDAIIVLGDAGLNYCEDYNDEYAKKIVNELGHLVYIVRGNHEIRPSNLHTMKYKFDINIQGNIFYEEDYPNIRYLDDYAIYSFNGYTVGVIGGAYSVDKYYRIDNGYKWFIDEQLTDDEKRAAMSVMANQDIDIMLTHTCPIEWQPRDLFLPMLDQESVDASMEEFLSDIRKYTDYGSWAFGHYHDDRNVRPGVYLLHKAVISLDDLIECKEIKDLKYDTKYDKED